MIWAPMVRTGDSELIGSWKIRPMRRPRMARISRLFGASSLISVRLPSTSRTMRPPATFACRSMIRSSARAVTLLPEPLSPTRHKVRPANRSKPTLRTACRMWVRR